MHNLTTKERDELLGITLYLLCPQGHDGQQVGMVITNVLDGVIVTEGKSRVMCPMADWPTNSHMLEFVTPERYEEVVRG